MDPRIRIHLSEAWIRGCGSTPKCHGSATLPVSAGGTVRQASGQAARIVHYRINSQGADLPPLPLRVAKAGKNHLNEEIIPLSPLE